MYKYIQFVLSCCNNIKKKEKKIYDSFKEICKTETRNIKGSVHLCY